MAYAFTPEPQAALAIKDSDKFFPVARVFCVGRNYAEHAREMGSDPSREPPFFFMKPASAVIPVDAAGGTVIPYPLCTSDFHHEVELVVALGSGGCEITPQAAESLIYGYAVGLDLTRRDLQGAAKKARRPWDTAKAFDASAPVSAIAPKTKTGICNSGKISLTVNGETRQTGNIADMIWPVNDVIAELSRFFTLRPGDLIFTGTPAGVGPLKPGDQIEAQVADIGDLRLGVGPR